jgi:site-specific DNA recombinase
MAPELFKAFADAFVQELNRLNREEAGKAGRLQAELAQVERQIERLVDAIAGGADARALNARIKTLEARQQEVSDAIEAAPATSKPLLHPNLAELYRRKVADLATAINAPECRDEAFELIRSLIDRVVLTPDDGQLRVDLQGDLAGILALCEEGARGRKPAASVEARAEQIKVVAGERNQRYFHFTEARIPRVA